VGTRPLTCVVPVGLAPSCAPDSEHCHWAFLLLLRPSVLDFQGPCWKTSDGCVIVDAVTQLPLCLCDENTRCCRDVPVPPSYMSTSLAWGTWSVWDAKSFQQVCTYAYPLRDTSCTDHV
jgi:hypothetical protein